MLDITPFDQFFPPKGASVLSNEQKARIEALTAARRIATDGATMAQVRELAEYILSGSVKRDPDLPTVLPRPVYGSGEPGGI